MPTGKGTPVLVRLQPDALARLDNWAAEQAIESRPEAIRQLLARGLDRPSTDREAAKKATALTYTQIIKAGRRTTK
jgi:metal-responsive CopG/Arc/MetJ family transcriptional regulator